MDKRIQNKKDIFYVCHTCKQVNPFMILIEHYEINNEQPYKIQILFADHMEKKYNEENIILKEGIDQKTFQSYMCCKCKLSIEFVNEDNARDIIQYLNEMKSYNT